MSDISRIRNFSIIAHIDHGKSTLADRMLEITHTIEDRKMRAQVLDSMELEKERGITIKMQPVRMRYEQHPGQPALILNLIDTPGHVDFYYEVSRALRAVEGSILLVDATQGVQAQTLSTLAMAREAGLVIIPAVSKIDSPLARTDEVKEEIVKLLDCKVEDIMECSGRTGQGVKELLDAVVARIPAPRELLLEDRNKEGAVQGKASERARSSQSTDGSFRALIFDFQYSNHTGVIIYVRVTDGETRRLDKLSFKAANRSFITIETGIFAPEETPSESLSAGEIGYIVTGIKEPGIASVGDTVVFERDLKRDEVPALSGYMSPKPVVWASVYPESQDDFNTLRQGLGRLRLSDSAFTFEEESSGTLGRGFRCGFLGMLHLEIITERLRREFKLELVVTTPSITYEVHDRRGGKRTVYSPALLPDYGEITLIREPWVTLKIITPSAYLGPIMQLLYDHEAEIGETESFSGDRNAITVDMPLRELMRNFFDEIKSISSGFASLSYQIGPMRDADVVKLEILVADESVAAFARVVSRRRVEEEAEKAVEKLHGILPRQMFATKIQGKALGRIISSRTLSAMKKDVIGHLYGGDVSRKNKLLDQQKEGKKRMKERGTVNISQDVFLKMMKRD